MFVENQIESMLSWSIAHCAYELVSWPSFHCPINMLPSMACQFGTLELATGSASTGSKLYGICQSHHTLALLENESTITLD